MKRSGMIASLVAFAVVAIVGFGLLVLSKIDSGDGDTNTTTAPTEQASDQITPSQPTQAPDLTESTQPSESETKSETKKFSVNGNNFSFSPNEIRVKKGDTVQITFVNKSGIHDFVIDEFSVATKQIGSGKQAVVEFVADKSGTFEFYCSVSNHRAMGMTGSLVVE